MGADFEFTCVKCGEKHRGVPTFGADAPLSYYAVPNERQRRCALGSDDCIIDEKWSFRSGMRGDRRLQLAGPLRLGCLGVAEQGEL
jgi:hypothetical protein